MATAMVEQPSNFDLHVPQAATLASFAPRNAAIIMLQRYFRRSTAQDPKKISAAYKAFHKSQDLKEIYEHFLELKHLCIPFGCNLFERKYHYLRDRVGTSHFNKRWWAILDERRHSGFYTGWPGIGANVVVVGGGPTGLRFAIEAAMLGCNVTVLEKRDAFTRWNVLHIWDTSVEDLKALGIKVFNPRFGSGDLQNVPIRELQAFLLKCCLVLGVDFVPNSKFFGILAPDANCHVFRAQAMVKVWGEEKKKLIHYPCHVLVGAGGSSSAVARVAQFKRKTSAGTLAIGITINFVNKGSKQERHVPQLKKAYQFDRKLFKKIQDKTGIFSENLIYFRCPTNHYFVLTPKKKGLLKVGILKQDLPVDQLFRTENVDRAKLLAFGRQMLGIAGLPEDLDFCTYQDKEDVAMFDFSHRTKSEEATRLFEWARTMLPETQQSETETETEAESEIEPQSPDSASEGPSSPKAEPETPEKPADDPSAKPEPAEDPVEKAGESSTEATAEPAEATTTEEASKGEAQQEEPDQRATSPPVHATGRDARLLTMLAGDALLEPFWPQGTGANRAICAALDSAWTLKKYLRLDESREDFDQELDYILEEREHLFGIMAQVMQADMVHPSASSPRAGQKIKPGALNDGHLVQPKLRYQRAKYKRGCGKMTALRLPASILLPQDTGKTPRHELHKLAPILPNDAPDRAQHAVEHHEDLSDKETVSVFVHPAAMGGQVVPTDFDVSQQHPAAVAAVAVAAVAAVAEVTVALFVHPAARGSPVVATDLDVSQQHPAAVAAEGTLAAPEPANVELTTTDASDNTVVDATTEVTEPDVSADPATGVSQESPPQVESADPKAVAVSDTADQAVAIEPAETTKVAE